MLGEKALPWILLFRLSPQLDGSLELVGAVQSCPFPSSWPPPPQFGALHLGYPLGWDALRAGRRRGQH